MNKQALIKLAQVRLAINYVLRNRMQKQATSNQDASATIPTWSSNPYDNGQEFSQPNEFFGKTYYRSQADLDANLANPNLARRNGKLSDLPPESITPRMAIGPLWNKMMANWEWSREKPVRDWRKQWENLPYQAGAPPMRDANGNPNPELDTYMNNWRKANPKPKVTPFPQQLYMRRPDGTEY